MKFIEKEPNAFIVEIESDNLHAIIVSVFNMMPASRRKSDAKYLLQGSDLTTDDYESIWQSLNQIDK